MSLINLFNSLAALGALAFSLYNFWHNKYRKRELQYVCTKWTVIGMTKREENIESRTAGFLVNISIRNEGAQSIEVGDIVLKVIDRDNSIFYYSPVTLFDLDYYSDNLGNANMLKTQKGLVPLPVLIEGNSTFVFGNHLLFLPWDKINGVNLDKVPLQIEVLVKDELSNYEVVANQYLNEEDTESLQNGSYSSVESSYTKKKRESFIKKVTTT